MLTSAITRLRQTGCVPAEDLAAGGARQVVHKFDALRDLETGQASLAVIQQLRLRDGHVGSPNNPSHWDLTEMRVRLGEYAGTLDRGVGPQDGLDLLREELHPDDVDEVLDP